MVPCGAGPLALSSQHCHLLHRQHGASYGSPLPQFPLFADKSHDNICPLAGLPSEHAPVFNCLCVVVGQPEFSLIQDISLSTSVSQALW
jgi:hypothetical protein